MNTIIVGWDAVNRMTSLSVSGVATSYAYRADGMRVKKTKGADVTRSYYDGQMPVEEDSVVSGTSSVTRNFVGARGIESIFTTTTSGTTTAFPLYDCHGNMVATVSRSGAGFVTSNVRTYDVWGGVRTGANTGGMKGRYVANLGHVQDDESGLIYMRARYYEPESGRFISEDSVMDGSNWYVYADNNPVTSIDFSGKSKFSAAASIFLVTALLTFAINAFVSDIILNSVISGLIAVVGGTVIGACIKVVSQVINRLIMNAIAAYILAPYALLDSPTTAAAEKSLGGPAVLAISRHIAMISALLLCIAIDEIM